MTVIVNSGSTLVVPSTGLTLTADSTIAAGGVLDDSSGGTITGGFNLNNFGQIISNTSGGLTIDTASFTNEGSIAASGPITIEPSVDLTNLVGGTLTGGVWNILRGFDLLDGTISTLNAHLINYNGSDFEAGPGGTGTQSIANTLTEIASGAVLGLDTSLAAPGPLNVDGEVTLSDSTDLSAVGGVTVSSTGTLISEPDFGVTIGSPLILDGILTLDFLTDLQLDGNVSGSGTIQNNASTALTFASSGTFAPAVTLQGSGIVANISPNLPGLPGPVDETIVDPSGIFNSFLIENQSNVSTMATLELVDATAANVTFNGPPTGSDHGVLILDQPAGFTGTIVGLNNHSTIVLKGIVGDVANIVTNPFIMPTSGLCRAGRKGSSVSGSFRCGRAA